jgi:hypothetical protein
MMKKLKEGRGGKLTSGGEMERRMKKVHLSVSLINIYYVES